MLDKQTFVLVNIASTVDIPKPSDELGGRIMNISYNT